MHLSHAAAQALMVAAQGLHRRPSSVASKADLLATIRRMGVLQIDTIHVVARSPYLVLWSRLGAFPQEWLTSGPVSGNELAFKVDTALRRFYFRHIHYGWIMPRTQRR